MPGGRVYGATGNGQAGSLIKPVSVAKAPDTTLWVQGLPPAVKEDDLRRFFARESLEAGKVTICLNAEGKCKGYGFVDFKSRDDAAHAVKTLSGVTVAGNLIKLEIKDPFDIRTRLQAAAALGRSIPSLVNKAVGKAGGTANATNAEGAGSERESADTRNDGGNDNYSDAQGDGGDQWNVEDEGGLAEEGGTKLHVGGLVKEVEQSDVRQLFEENGILLRAVSIVMDESGTSKGFAIANLKDSNDVSKALELNGLELLGLPITVALHDQGSSSAPASAPETHHTTVPDAVMVDLDDSVDVTMVDLDDSSGAPMVISVDGTSSSGGKKRSRSP